LEVFAAISQHALSDKAARTDAADFFFGSADVALCCSAFYDNRAMANVAIDLISLIVGCAPAFSSARYAAKSARAAGAQTWEEAEALDASPRSTVKQEGMDAHTPHAS